MIRESQELDEEITLKPDMSPSKGMDITDRSILGNITPGDPILNSSMKGTQEVEFWSRKFPVFQDGGE